MPRWRLVLWAALAASYAVFWLWYGGSTSPLTAEEVERYVAVADAHASGTPLPERIRRFAEGDDGREFYMFNRVQYRERPEYADGRRPESDDDREIERLYTSQMLPKLVARASHPVVGIVPIQDMASLEGVPLWDRALVVRYRSRRDFLDIIMTPEFFSDIPHKEAALAQNVSSPSQLGIGLYLGPRGVVGLLLFGLGVLLPRARSVTPTEQREAA